MIARSKKVVNIGIIGCGSVSEMYLDFLRERSEINLYACSDLRKELAVNTAKRYGIANVMETTDLIKNEEIEIILNLTNPVNHFKLNMDALMNKKAVFCEKPLALKYKETLKLLEIAKQNKCLFYAAPDTYYSKAVQAARILLEKGKIGEVLATTVTSISAPVESWHPNPMFFYKDGAGPLYDRGVYHITSLVFLFGPVIEVSAYSSNYVTRRFFKQRNEREKYIKVDVPTNYVALLRFKSGVMATVLLSFDLKAIPLESDTIQVFGTDGSIKLPTPVLYSGNTSSYDFESRSWMPVDNMGQGYERSDDVRGAAVIDMIGHLKRKRLSYDNIELASHVIEIMNAVDRSSSSSKQVKLLSTCKKPSLIK